VRYNAGISQPVITFDAGQTLIELDLDFLATRLGERGLSVEVAALTAAMPSAWAHYDALVAQGTGHPWRDFMAHLLQGAAVPEPTPHVEWLWEQQPTRNLFRRPIPPMLAVAQELAAAGARIAVLSNSEGRLVELLTEIAIAPMFPVIVDSGRLGIEKPDPRIFAHTLRELGSAGPPDVIPIHIGDSWSADIVGARRSGWRAIWYGRNADAVHDPEIASAHSADDVRATLRRWGAL
jgi:FMN phosphatase YigB (HAD superfamily)